MKFEAYADLVNMGTHLDFAAEQSSFIRHDGLDDNSLLISKTVRALYITKCEGKALSLVSLVPRRQDFEAWRVFKEEYDCKCGNRTAAFSREASSTHAPDGKRWTAFWEKVVAQ